MARFLVFFLFVVAVGSAAAWLADHPGSLSLVWGGWRIETTVPVVVAFLVVLVILSAVGYQLWHWLVVSPARLGAVFRGNRREKGYRALTEGMAAIAAGEARTAAEAAARAEKLLDGPPMAKLLRAQAAQLAGDDDTAERYFKAMLETSETELVGLRGLLIQAGRMGDHERARELAARAKALRPGAGWAVRALLDLQISAGDWPAALQTLQDGRRYDIIEKDVAAHQRAVLDIAQAGVDEGAGRLREALTRVEDALKQDPDHVPAAVLEARLLVAAGKERRAVKHLTEFWKRKPHPEIARAFRALKPSEEPAARLRRFESLYLAAPDEPESLLQMGRLALDAGDLERARRMGEQAAEAAEIVDQRFCRLMVDVEERSEEGATAAREWLVRLAEAPPAPHWACDACGTPARTWVPLCGHCGAFDGLVWERPRPADDAVLLVEKKEGGKREERDAITVEAS